jgi:hypothetical protein
MKCPIEIAQEMSAWRALEKDRMVTSSRKNDGATGCGKAARWKSQKTDFPTSLGNPANPAGFPRIIKGRPFEVGFECDAKLYRKEHPYGH